MKLTKHEIRDISHARNIRHTVACRTKPGNVKGDGGHRPGVTAGPDGQPKIDLGGYRCLPACRFMDRIYENVDALLHPGL